MPLPQVFLRKMEPVSRSLVGSGSGAAAAAINVITAFTGRFFFLFFLGVASFCTSFVLFIYLLFFNCTLRNIELASVI